MNNRLFSAAFGVCVVIAFGSAYAENFEEGSSVSEKVTSLTAKRDSLAKENERLSKEEELLKEAAEHLETAGIEYEKYKQEKVAELSAIIGDHGAHCPVHFSDYLITCNAQFNRLKFKQWRLEHEEKFYQFMKLVLQVRKSDLKKKREEWMQKAELFLAENRIPFAKEEKVHLRISKTLVTE